MFVATHSEALGRFNAAIGRRLNAAGITAVLEDLHARGECRFACSLLLVAC